MPGFTKLHSLAGCDGVIIPGLDPLVMQRYPAASDVGEDDIDLYADDAGRDAAA